MKLLSEFRLADLLVRYVTDSAGRSVGLTVLPADAASRVATKRSNLAGVPEIEALPEKMRPESASSIDPLVHLKLAGDAYAAGFSCGHTLRHSASNRRLTYAGQSSGSDSGVFTITTTLKGDAGLRVEHRLRWREGERAIMIDTVLINGLDKPITVEALTSFSLGGLTAFDPADASGRLSVHRFRSVWAAEGRLDTQTLESLHLERSWIGASLLSERFGQIGSMPVRKWFPFVAVEDTRAGITWAAQLAWAGSWQMEISRQTDDVAISGGLADRDFGHWCKTLAPGERLDTPPATITCVSGSLDQACDRLTAVQHHAADSHPAIEQDLPVVFNEWCTTWGDPAHDRIVRIADRLKDSGVTYLVIDAGWYKSGSANWSSAHGDWVPDVWLFPIGLKAVCDDVRHRGLIPGLWFEFETVSNGAKAFAMTDHQLKRDGQPLTVGGRRFWDLNDPVAVDYLAERVIGRLEECGFGYMKVDYNDTIGIGCDHADGLGEGLRQQTLGTHRFFDLIRERLPDLVIENCASGGHRLEPSMIARSAMSSFSDAHETREIPIIAARLHHLLLPRQSQIWAVLRAGDSPQRLIYSLAATFLGRMCLSGDIDNLDEAQWHLVRSAIGFYKSVAPIVKDGISRHMDQIGASWRYPTGHQAVVRTSADGGQALVVLHTFADGGTRVHVPLPAGNWKAGASLGRGAIDVESGRLTWRPPGDWSGEVVHLLRADD